MIVKILERIAAASGLQRRGSAHVAEKPGICNSLPKWHVERRIDERLHLQSGAIIRYTDNRNLIEEIFMSVPSIK